MFLGEYDLKFTGQGRIVLPRRFREELGEDIIILSRGLDNCIWGFEKSAWEEEAKRQLEHSVTEKEALNLRRYLFSAAEQVSLDRQGRFVIPTKLLEYAQIGEEVIVIGAGDHFEVWDPKRWQVVIDSIERK